MDIARAEKDLEVATKVESFYPIPVQLERLIVDGPDEVAICSSALIEDCAAGRILLGLREHKGGELFAAEFARAIKQRAVEVFVERDLASVESGKREFVAVLEIFPVQAESFSSFLARVAIPSVGQDNAADIPKQRSDLGHKRFLPAIRCSWSSLDSTACEKEAIRSLPTTAPLWPAAYPQAWLGYCAKLR